MDSGVDTVCSVDQTSERRYIASLIGQIAEMNDYLCRVEQKGRFRIIESNSSPCASDTVCIALETAVYELMEKLCTAL